MRKDIDWIAGLRAFTAVAARRSFAQAARDLGLSTSALSRRVDQIEQALAVRLLHRTTRQVSLTTAGEEYLDRAERLLNSLSDANALAGQGAAEPAGPLRITIPNLFGQRWVAPILTSFAAEYPSVRLEVQLTDRWVDLAAERIDLCVRIGALPDTELVGRQLCGNRRWLCASPAYLATRAAPQTSDDLANYDLLHFSPAQDGLTWRLTGDGRTRAVRVAPRFQADNAEVLRQAAVDGLGIANLATFVIAEDLAAGRLVRVLPELEAARTQVWVLYQKAQLLPLKTRLLIDALAGSLRDEPWMRGL